MSHSEQNKTPEPQSKQHTTHWSNSTEHFEQCCGKVKASWQIAYYARFAMKPSQFASRRVCLVCQVIRVAAVLASISFSASMKASCNMESSADRQLYLVMLC